MQRVSIGESVYHSILEKLEITQMCAGDMSLIVGVHEALGRVVLVRSGLAFAVIADCVTTIVHHYKTDWPQTS